MSLDRDALLTVLRDCGLFTTAAFEPVRAAFQLPHENDEALLRHLVAAGYLTHYQLRKAVNNRTSDLFVGPYVILDKLGEGGMGKVFKAKHARQEREIALKVVREQVLARPTARGRYEREVQTALALNHPNIVSVFSAGTTNGRYYIEMEFVDGLDLARMVHRFGPLEVAEACEYARQAALGLHHAHERGFIHRDIKPGNIMVSGTRHRAGADEPACVKVMDMGLVRLVGEDLEDRGLTRDGTVVGTPDYMAPEQAKNSRVVDRRADLYSLGATMVFMLTGKPPFPYGTALDKILQHLDHAPPQLHRIRPDVPEAVSRVVERLMAKSPQRRYGTGAELAEELAPLARVPGVSKPPTPPKPSEPPVSGKSELVPPLKEHPFPSVIIILAAFVALALVAILVMVVRVALIGSRSS
jgi:serine/threonine-protein kinase